MRVSFRAVPWILSSSTYNLMTYNFQPIFILHFMSTPHLCTYLNTIHTRSTAPYNTNSYCLFLQKQNSYTNRITIKTLLSLNVKMQIAGHHTWPMIDLEKHIFTIRENVAGASIPLNHLISNPSLFSYTKLILYNITYYDLCMPDLKQYLRSKYV